MGATREELITAEKEAYKLLKQTLIESDDGYNLFITEHYELIENVKPINEKIAFINVEINTLLDIKLGNAKHWHNNVPLTEKINASCFENAVIDDLIEFCNEQKDIFVTKLEIANEEYLSVQPKKKLTWNGQNNAIIDFFKQAKKKLNKEGKPLIPNPTDEIAVFLKEGFDCFSDAKIESIQTQLNRGKRPKKSENLIDL